jgi:hypothetical protein
MTLKRSLGIETQSGSALLIFGACLLAQSIGSGKWIQEPFMGPPVGIEATVAGL